jgi:hypothetical protein
MWFKKKREEEPPFRHIYPSVNTLISNAEDIIDIYKKSNKDIRKLHSDVNALEFALSGAIHYINYVQRSNPNDVVGLPKELLSQAKEIEGYRAQLEALSHKLYKEINYPN